MKYHICMVTWFGVEVAFQKSPNSFRSQISKLGCNKKEVKIHSYSNLNVHVATTNGERKRLPALFSVVVFGP